MIHKLAHKVVENMIKENIITTRYAHFYEYNFIVKVESLLTILSILTMAIYYELLGPMVAFLIFFLELRKRTGGYHAKTFLRCFMISNTIIYVFIKVLYPILMGQKMEFIFAGVTITSVIIFKIGTVNHPNWNLNHVEYMQMRSVARKTVLLEYLVILTIMVFGGNRSYIILMVFAIILCALTLLLSRICNLKYKMEV